MRLHCETSQKSVILIITVMGTQNLMQICISVTGYGSKSNTERRHGAGGPVCSKLWLGVLVLMPCGLD
jgi:hypothetical protein